MSSELIGMYAGRKVDSKLRICIPSELLDSKAEYYLARQNLDPPGVILYTEGEYQNGLERIRHLGDGDSERINFLRVRRVKIDSAHRLRLTDMGFNEGDLVRIVGNLNCMFIEKEPASVSI